MPSPSPEAAAMSGPAPPAFESLGGAGPPRAAAAILGEMPRAPAGRDRPHVRLNMVSTLDGRAALDGGTRQLGGPGDLEMLLELRVLADAVLVGSGTLRTEGYGRLMRSPERRRRRVEAGLAADPCAVLVSRGLDLPWDAGLFAAGEQPVLVYTASASAPPPTAAQVEVVRLPHLDPASLLSDLRRRGIGVLLCEGGPTLNAWLLAAGGVDELFLTLAPLLTGHAHEPAIVAGPGLTPPVGAELEWVLRHESALFLRYRMRR